MSYAKNVTAAQEAEMSKFVIVQGKYVAGVRLGRKIKAQHKQLGKLVRYAVFATFGGKFHRATSKVYN